MPQEAVAAFAPPPESASATIPDFVVPDLPTTPAEPKAKPVRRGRMPAEKSKGLSTAAAWSFFALATLACALVLLREPLGHKALWLTDLYEAIGLPVEGPNDWFKFDGVALERNEVDGQINLLVRGKVINTSRKAREVPQLKLYWRQKSGELGPETVLQARPAKIAVGDAARFSGELRGVEAALGGEVKVTFVDAKGKAAPAASAEHAAAPHAAPAAAPAEHEPAKAAPHEAAPEAHSETPSEHSPEPVKEDHAPAAHTDPHATGH